MFLNYSCHTEAHCIHQRKEEIGGLVVIMTSVSHNYGKRLRLFKDSDMMALPDCPDDVLPTVMYLRLICE